MKFFLNKKCQIYDRHKFGKTWKLLLSNSCDEFWVKKYGATSNYRFAVAPVIASKVRQRNWRWKTKGLKEVKTKKKLRKSVGESLATGLAFTSFSPLFFPLSPFLFFPTTATCYGGNNKRNWEKKKRSKKGSRRALAMIDRHFFQFRKSYCSVTLLTHYPWHQTIWRGKYKKWKLDVSIDSPSKPRKTSEELVLHTERRFWLI